MMVHCSIQGFGVFAPEKCCSNADLEKIVDTDNEWIVTRTGIQNRHILSEGETCSFMGTAAAREALERAKIDPDEISHVIVGTSTADYLCPNTACVISNQLGLHGPMAFDLVAACSGFVYGLEVSQGILLAKPNSKILLIASEALTRRVNWQDRGTCIVFGDGAGAVIISNSESDTPPAGAAYLEDITCHADGHQGHLLWLGGGTKTRHEIGDPIDEKFYIHMEGREIYKHAVHTLTNVCHEILERNGYTVDDVDILVPHQANARIIEAVAKRLKIKNDRVFMNIQEYGNTSAATIPLALGDAAKAGIFTQGKLVLLATFGGGFTWGAALMRF